MEPGGILIYTGQPWHPSTGDDCRGVNQS
ncbi:class I SAM-dependent methyltransferase family protein [Escherichia coli]